MKIAVMGVAGRMGQQLVRAIHEAEGCTVAGATERPDSPIIGTDVGTLAGIGPIGVTVSDDPLEVIANCEGILDFTAAEGDGRVRRARRQRAHRPRHRHHRPDSG